MLSSNAMPHVISASGCACSVMSAAAPSISSRSTSGAAVKLIITPFAPEIEVSSSGLEIEPFAA